MGLLPLDEPDTMEYAIMHSQIVLYFMINLVYSCIAPIMSYILLICFGVLGLVYRHQFISMYSKTDDSGGKNWPELIMLLISCMIISQFTLIGIVFLKLAYLPAVLLFPLIACTILFRSYIKQQHFHVSKYVPSTLCSSTDKANNHEDLDLSFLKDQYLQPAMKETVKFTEMLSTIEIYVDRTSEGKVSGGQFGKSDAMSNLADIENV